MGQWHGPGLCEGLRGLMIEGVRVTDTQTARTGSCRPAGSSPHTSGGRRGFVNDNYTGVTQCELPIAWPGKHNTTENCIIRLVPSFAWTVWFYSGFYVSLFLAREVLSFSWSAAPPPSTPSDLFTFQGADRSKKVNELLKLFQVIKVRNVQAYNLKFCLPLLLSNQNIKIITDTG